MVHERAAYAGNHPRDGKMQGKNHHNKDGEKVLPCHMHKIYNPPMYGKICHTSFLQCYTCRNILRICQNFFQAKSSMSVKWWWALSARHCNSRNRRECTATFLTGYGPNSPM